VDIDACAMPATAPHGLVRTVQPDGRSVILASGGRKSWMAGGVENAARLLRPCPAANMRIQCEGLDAKADGVTASGRGRGVRCWFNRFRRRAARPRISV
jgi:hypothetical protein